MEEPKLRARLETSRGELVRHVEVMGWAAPVTIVLGQRVFILAFPGDMVAVYREQEGVYVAG